MTEDQKIKPKRLPRLISLDLIRGIAAYMMVQGHFIYSTVNSHLPNIFITDIYPNFWFTRLYFFMSENFIYSLGWSMFFLIIGIGLAISIESQKLKKASFKFRFLHVLKRTGIFLLVQYVFNIASFGFLPPPDVTLDIFTAGTLPPSGILFYLNPISSFSYQHLIAEIGLWSLVVFFLMELPIRVRVAIVVIIGYIGYYVVPLKGNMLVYILIGGIFGSFLVSELLKGKSNRVFKTFLIFGCILFGIGLPVHLLNLNAIITSSPIYTNYGDILASPGFILYSMGLIWIFFAIFYWIIDIRKNYHKAFRPLVLLGNLTLTIYVLHFILLNQMLYSLKFNSYFYLPTGWVWNFALLIFIYIGAVYWSRYNFKFSLEWVIQKIR